ncbi:unnamed protein product [Protopolystoma xenopodis]|uniref:Uncharacterized protein n=1 Tax=Protopolystoma xenopodis TaxID=117903 RepID=A0A3S5AHI5_9PLAT|nr:unnamed protein product [Protopolystoma xenopodis]
MLPFSERQNVSMSGRQTVGPVDALYATVTFVAVGVGMEVTSQPSSSEASRQSRWPSQMAVMLWQLHVSQRNCSALGQMQATHKSEGIEAILVNNCVGIQLYYCSLYHSMHPLALRWI